MGNLGSGNIAQRRDVFLIDDNMNIKYIDANGKEYGDKIKEKILEDETKIRFANKEFSEYISSISGAKEEDMKFEWMKNQITLTLSDLSISSLEDLVFFPNLKTIYLKNLTLDNLNGIENCTQLEYFESSSKDVKKYDALKELKLLKSFYRMGTCDFNNVVDTLKEIESLKNLTIKNSHNINVAKLNELKGLEKLILELNSIENFNDFNYHENLKVLSIKNNKIEDLQFLENLPNLTELNLSINNISDIIPIKNNTNLINLDLRGNANIDGNRSNYTKERLNALNKISEVLDRGGTINIDVDKLRLFTNYTVLDLSSQNLTNLYVLEGLIKLKRLNLRSNNITLEDAKSQEILSSMTELNSLDLSANNVGDINCINGLKKLTYLCIGGSVDLVQIQDIISNLSTLRVTTESLKTIENCDVEKITALNLFYSNISELPNLSKFTNLRTVDLKYNQDITNLSELENITSLENLNLSNMNLHGNMINFSKLQNLQQLVLSNNTLWSEDLVTLIGLKDNKNLVLNLSNNAIIDASVLLQFDTSIKINLKNNINLSQDSKNKLKERFGSNVSF